jgi:hypothetical protein
MTRTYPLEELRRRLFLLIAAIVTLAGVMMAGVSAWLIGADGYDVLDLIVITLPASLMVAFAAGIVRATQRVRLELSESGIRLVVPGATIEADWADVGSVGPAFWGPLTGEALRLRRRARLRRSWWFALVEDPTWSDAIPLAPFALPVRGSRLEADIRARLPALFA